MRHWEYVELGDNGEVVTRRLSDEDILRYYYPYWCGEMCRVGKADQISAEDCIQDFVTVHWAHEI
jgi:hypothetical protein